MDYFFGKEPRLVYSSKVAASSLPRSLDMKVLPGPIPSRPKKLQKFQPISGFSESVTVFSLIMPHLFHVFCTSVFTTYRLVRDTSP